MINFLHCINSNETSMPENKGIELDHFMERESIIVKGATISRTTKFTNKFGVESNFLHNKPELFTE